MLTRAVFAVALVSLVMPSTSPTGFNQSKESRQLRVIANNLAGPLSGVAVLIQKKRTFKFVYRTCESGCIETYESSNGQEVSLTLACHTSTDKEARREMQRMIREGRALEFERSDVFAEAVSE